MKLYCVFLKRYAGRPFSAAILLVFTVFLICTLLSSPAFALNSDYMNPDKWINNPNVHTENIKYTLNSEDYTRQINGHFKYCTDSKLSIYTDFEITENTLSEENDIVYVTYCYHMGGESYCVTVDKNGTAEVSEENQKANFRAESCFRTNSYISSAQYTGKDYTHCTVDVSLNVNGYAYNITKNKKLCPVKIYMELPTTVKTTKATTVKTTVKKEKKTTAPKSTKAKKNKTTAAKSIKAKKETTTKFKPRYNVTTTAAVQKQNVQTGPPAKSTTKTALKAAAAESVIVSEVTSEAVSGKYKANPVLKQYIPLFIILVIAGIAALIIGAVKGRKEKEPSETESE